MLPVLIRCSTFRIRSVSICLGSQPKPRLAPRNIHSILPLSGKPSNRPCRKQDLSSYHVRISAITLSSIIRWSFQICCCPPSLSTCRPDHESRYPLAALPVLPSRGTTAELSLDGTRSHYGNRKLWGYLWVTNLRFEPAKSMECTLDDKFQVKQLRPVILDLHNRLEIVTNRSIPMSGHS